MISSMVRFMSSPRVSCFLGFARPRIRARNAGQQTSMACTKRNKRLARSSNLDNWSDNEFISTPPLSTVPSVWKRCFNNCSSRLISASCQTISVSSGLVALEGVRVFVCMACTANL
jgi:hypothetical protein